MGLSNVKRTPCSTADDALQMLAMVRDLVLIFYELHLSKLQRAMSRMLHRLTLMQYACAGASQQGGCWAQPECAVITVPHNIHPVVQGHQFG